MFQHCLKLGGSSFTDEQNPFEMELCSDSFVETSQQEICNPIQIETPVAENSSFQIISSSSEHNNVTMFAYKSCQS